MPELASGAAAVWSRGGAGGAIQPSRRRPRPPQSLARAFVDKSGGGRPPPRPVRTACKLNSPSAQFLTRSLRATSVELWIQSTSPPDSPCRSPAAAGSPGAACATAASCTAARDSNERHSLRQSRLRYPMEDGCAGAAPISQVHTHLVQGISARLAQPTGSTRTANQRAADGRATPLCEHPAPAAAAGRRPPAARAITAGVARLQAPPAPEQVSNWHPFPQPACSAPPQRCRHVRPREASRLEAPPVRTGTCTAGALQNHAPLLFAKLAALM